MRSGAPSASAFSLVEVVMALAVVSFALLSLLALLPLSVNSGRDTLEQTIGASIASAISSDFHVTAHSSGSGNTTPRFALSYTPGTTTSLFFDQDNNFSTTSSGTPIYRATVTIGPAQPNSPSTTFVRIFVTWPALADSNPAQTPLHYTGSIDVCTAVNPNSP